MNDYALFKYLVQHTALENKEILDLISKADCVHIKKGKEWIPRLHRPYALGFVSNGLFGLFIKATPHQVLGFASENQWIHSFVSTSDKLDKSSNQCYDIPYIHRAIEDSSLYCYTADQLEDLSTSYHSFLFQLTKMYQLSQLDVLHHLASMSTLDAEQRYNIWVEAHQDLAQRIPQYLVASFLGILPTSLSRLRNKIYRK